MTKEAMSENANNRLSPDDYVEGILSGDITVISKAITVVESTLEADLETSQIIIEKCLPLSGNSVRIGITGVPGVGKSTFIDTLGSYLTNEKGKRVAVLAVDPSSQISKGSILGDKVRMDRLSKDKNAYIRSSPSSGSLGGVTNRTREAIIVTEAAGYEVIIVETVGVGQSETVVNSMVDFFLLLHLAGAGDELQGIKRGIMEIADLIAINKADGSNIDKSNLAKKQFESALKLFPHPESGWLPGVVTCSSLENTGIEEIWDKIEEYCEITRESGYFEKNRQQQAKHWLYETLSSFLEQSFYGTKEVKEKIPVIEKEVLEGKINTFKAARKLIELYKSNKNGN